MMLKLKTDPWQKKKMTCTQYTEDQKEQVKTTGTEFVA